jgi:hypothetical protein
MIKNALQARLMSLRELQSATGEELRPFFGRTLLPSAEGATAGRGHSKVSCESGIYAN